MPEYKRSWFGVNNLYPEHTELLVRQVYLWFLTRDGQIAIVENKTGGYQLPGGKPEAGENNQQTLRRELNEECGIDLVKFGSIPQLIGYYLIENDPDWQANPAYLQVRYLLKVEQLSSELELRVNETAGEKDNMRSAKFVNLKNLTDVIPYMYNLGEYKIASSLSY